jgi:hypothetical protein
MAIVVPRRGETSHPADISSGRAKLPNSGVHGVDHQPSRWWEGRRVAVPNATSEIKEFQAI